VDLNLTEEQTELGKVARQFFESRAPIRAVRDVEATEAGYLVDLYAEMAALDWLRLGHDEAVGGVGGGLVDLVVLYEEIGRALADTPHLHSAVLAAEVMARAPQPYARALAGDALSGDGIVIPAIVERSGTCRAEGLDPTSSLGSDSLAVASTKLMVPFASSATHFLLPLRTGSEREDGITLVLVNADAPGVTISPTPSIGGPPLSAVTVETEVGLDRVVGPTGAGWSFLRPALDRAAILRSAQIAGAGHRLLELAVEYANSRVQFGEPIGKHQAVQYLCTDIAVDAHLSQEFARYGAGLADLGLSYGAAASKAKAYASQASRRMVHRAHDVFAGVAFMLESDVQLFTRRMKGWELEFGDDAQHRQQLAGAVLRGEG
jgi:alkylation response protein AidB-like acyl-CoA dehydrogenase